MHLLLVIAPLRGRQHTHDNDENGVHYGSTLTRSLEDAQCRLYFTSNYKHKRAIIENFLMINDCFNCVTSGIMALGWLENKEEKPHADSGF